MGEMSGVEEHFRESCKGKAAKMEIVEEFQKAKSNIIDILGPDGTKSLELNQNGTTELHV